MKIMIDWNKLHNLPHSADKSFEEFCFHVFMQKYRHYGKVDYCYQTPGSEFYLRLNKPMEDDGVVYNVGDCIGLQAKFWLGDRDADNSSLNAHHRKELEDGIRLAYEDFLHNPMRAER